MTENELKTSCPNVYKSYRAKKGAVTRIAKKSKWLNAKVQYTDYSEKPACDTETICRLNAEDVVRDGIWEAVRDHLTEMGRIGEGNTDFLILHVVGFGEGWQQITGEVEF